METRNRRRWCQFDSIRYDGHYIWELAAQPFDIPTVYPALLGSLGCLVIVSLLGKPPDRDKWEPFQEHTGVV